MTSTTVLRTLCGLYLHTVVRRNSADEDCDRLADETGTAGWVDVDQTVKAAFYVAVARIYRTDSDVRYIRELIARAPARATGLNGSTTRSSRRRLPRRSSTTPGERPRS